MCVLGMAGGAMEICLSEKGVLVKKRLGNTGINISSKELQVRTNHIIKTRLLLMMYVAI